MQVLGRNGDTFLHQERVRIFPPHSAHLSLDEVLFRWRLSPQWPNDGEVLMPFLVMSSLGAGKSAREPKSAPHDAQPARVLESLYIFCPFPHPLMYDRTSR